MEGEPRSHMPPAQMPNIKQKQYFNKFNKDVKNLGKTRKTPCANDAGR